MEKLVYCIVDDERLAAKAIDALVNADFTRDEICVLLRPGPKGGHVEEIPLEVHTEVGHGMVIGSALGALGGALVAVASGTLLAAGPLVAMFHGVVSGGAGGLLTGFVGGLGYWHDAADFPHKKLGEGAVLVGAVTTKPGRVEKARAALAAVGAQDIRVSSRHTAEHAVQRSD